MDEVDGLELTTTGFYVAQGQITIYENYSSNLGGWSDQSPPEFRHPGNTSQKGKAIQNIELYFNPDGDGSKFTCAGFDEVTIWEQALPDSLIYHWKDAFAHQPYSTLDPGARRQRRRHLLPH